MSGSPDRRTLRDVLSLILKTLISGFLLYWIVRNVELAQLVQFFKTNLHLVFFVFLLSLIHLLNEFLRFWLVIRLGRFHPSGAKLIKVFFIGYAFRFLLPGGQGEVGKMLYIEGRRSHRLAAYVIEKGSQVYVIVLLFGLALAYLFPGYWFPGWSITALLAIAVIFWNRVTRIRYIRPYVPSKFGSRKFFLLESGLAILNVGIITLEYHLLLARFDPGILNVSAVVVVILTVIMIPVSLAGLGLRETAASQLLQRFGVPLDIGVGVPLLVFAFNVALPALIGVALFLTYRIELHGISFDNLLNEDKG